MIYVSLEKIIDFQRVIVKNIEIIFLGKTKTKLTYPRARFPLQILQDIWYEIIAHSNVIFFQTLKY